MSEPAMHIDEIVLPEDKPAWEWVRGRALQKQLPRLNHGRLQRAFGDVLHRWAREHCPGAVATEWDVRVQPPGDVPRPLVPDVAYVRSARLRALAPELRQIPPIAPDIVVEILSPGDRTADVEHKRDVYLAAGSALVIIVDPRTQTVHTYESDGTERTFTATDTLIAAPFPDLAIDLAPIFAELDDP